MKIFFADDSSHLFSHNLIRDFGKIKRFLVSYAAPKTKRYLAFYEYLKRKRNFELFLDCGAFSAFRVGAYINLESYIKFCKHYRYLFSVMGALDVIGSGTKSYENYLQMYNSGLKEVIPAWHYRDDKTLIKKYMELTDYIAIGNLVSISLDQQLRARVIREAINIMKSINPNVKIHLYGVTALNLIKMFGAEVESVDSTSWIAGGRYGQIYNSNGSFGYQGRLKKRHPNNSIRVNILNAHKILELEDFINEQVSRRKERQITVPLRHRRTTN